APLVADAVRHRPSRSGSGPSRSDGPLRGGLANHAFGREALQGACAVQRSESRDRNPAVGDDDLTTSPSSIEPIAEVRAQLGHGYLHTVNCTLAERRFVHVTTECGNDDLRDWRFVATSALASSELACGTC